MIGLSPTQVKIWFQNHRYKAKKGERDLSVGEETHTSQAHLPVLMPLDHIKTQRTLLAGYAAHDEGLSWAPTSNATRLHLHSKVCGGNKKDVGGVDSPTVSFDYVADNSDISVGPSSAGTSTQKKDIALATVRDRAWTKHFESDIATTNIQSDSSNMLSSQNWAQFSEHLSRLQYQQQKDLKNGGGASLTELKPVHIGDLGALAVSASSASGAEASSLAIGPPGSFGFLPSHYGSAYGSYLAVPVTTRSSYTYLADDGRTW